MIRLFLAAIIAASFLLQAANALDDLSELKEEYERPTEIPYPDHNPYSEAKEDLGKTLYYDPRLSASGTQSCATCHNPSLSYGDGMALGTGHGHKKLGRKSPTTLNLAWDELFMWDGRKSSLEDQATGPIEAAGEMNMSLEKLDKIIKSIKGYEAVFKKAFPKDANPVSVDNLAKAIATYERGIVSSDAPFDKWIKGDESAISKEAKRGFMLFNGKANCASCHSEWNFSDGSFHDIGLPDNDIGRGKFMPNRKSMQHAFKTVGLRNIELRSPYMHNGSLKTLEEVIEHYNNGFVKRDSLSDQIKTLNLTDQETSDLVEFMKSLTSVDEGVVLPILPQ